MKTDIEIAREAKLLPIKEIAAKIGIAEDILAPYGKHIAKVPYTTIDKEKTDKSNLILVTAITPTKACGSWLSEEPLFRSRRLSVRTASCWLFCTWLFMFC